MKTMIIVCICLLLLLFGLKVGDPVTLISGATGVIYGVRKGILKVRLNGGGTVEVSKASIKRIPKKAKKN